MAGDEGSNTLYIGRVIHTPTTPGLITRTYTPQKHCQTFIFLTPLRLDDQQYKEALEIPKQILILLPLWPLTLTTTAPASSDSSKPAILMKLSANTSDFKLTISARLNKSLPCHPLHPSQCPTLLPPSSFYLAPHPPLIALAILPTLSPLLLLKAPLIQR